MHKKRSPKKQVSLVKPCYRLTLCADRGLSPLQLIVAKENDTKPIGPSKESSFSNCLQTFFLLFFPIHLFVQVAVLCGMCVCVLLSCCLLMLSLSHQY